MTNLEMLKEMNELFVPYKLPMKIQSVKYHKSHYVRGGNILDYKEYDRLYNIVGFSKSEAIEPILFIDDLRYSTANGMVKIIMPDNTRHWFDLIQFQTMDEDLIFHSTIIGNLEEHIQLYRYMLEHRITANFNIDFEDMLLSVRRVLCTMQALEQLSV